MNAFENLDAKMRNSELSHPQPIYSALVCVFMNKYVLANVRTIRI